MFSKIATCALFVHMLLIYVLMSGCKAMQSSIPEHASVTYGTTSMIMYLLLVSNHNETNCRFLFVLPGNMWLLPDSITTQTGTTGFRNYDIKTNVILVSPTLKQVPWLLKWFQGSLKSSAVYTGS